jgi:hypothetical protein
VEGRKRKDRVDIGCRLVSDPNYTNFWLAELSRIAAKKKKGGRKKKKEENGIVKKNVKGKAKRAKKGRAKEGGWMRRSGMMELSRSGKGIGKRIGKKHMRIK